MIDELNTTGDEIIYGEKLPKIEDACKSCLNFSKRKRRLSTMTPASIECNLGCGFHVYEIHWSCLDCSKKFNKCPWCGKFPYEKCEENQKE